MNVDLFAAVDSGNISRIEACLRDRSADINALKDGKSALHIAVEKRFFLPTKMLIKAGALLDAQDINGRTPVFHAAFKKDFEAVRILLEAGANPDIQDKWGYTPLYAAADNRDVEIVKLLLNSECNPDIQDTEGRTALHRAAFRDHPASVELLIAAGANPKIRNKENHMPSEVNTTYAIRTRLQEYEKSYQPRTRETSGRTAPVRRERGAETTAGNIARLEQILAKKKMGAEAPAQAQEVKNAEQWQYMAPDAVAHVTDYPAAHYRLTEIFNFETRQYIYALQNRETGFESSSLKDFDEIRDKNMLGRAYDAFTKAGGKADPAVIETGFRGRHKTKFDEIKKGP